MPALLASSDLLQHFVLWKGLFPASDTWRRFAKRAREEMLRLMQALPPYASDKLGQETTVGICLTVLMR